MEKQQALNVYFDLMSLAADLHNDGWLEVESATRQLANKIKTDYAITDDEIDAGFVKD